MIAKEPFGEHTRGWTRAARFMTGLLLTLGHYWLVDGSSRWLWRKEGWGARLVPMLSLAADEDFSHHVLRGLWRRKPDLDLVLVRDVPEVSGTEDDQVLAWAAQEGRVVLSHDVNTMRFAAEQRTRAGLRMAGLILIRQQHAVGAIGPLIQDLLLVIECSLPGDWEGVYQYLPYQSGAR